MNFKDDNVLTSVIHRKVRSVEHDYEKLHEAWIIYILSLAPSLSLSPED